MNEKKIITNLELERLHNKLFSIMEYVQKICDDNNLKIFLIGGTLLGSVRNNGFIPWDDDVDMGMYYDDYIKLCDILKQTKSSKYEFDIPNYSTNYGYQFLKIYDKHTTLIENIEHYKYFKGIYIDIFPIIGLGNNILKARFIYKYYALLKLSLLIKKGLYVDKKFKKIKYLPCKVYNVIFSEQTLITKMKKLREKYDIKTSKYIGDIDGSIKGIVLLEKCKDFISHKFESKEFLIFEEYKYYLTSVYGDYTKLPPESEQKPPHIFHLSLDVGFEEYKNKYYYKNDL